MATVLAHEIRNPLGSLELLTTAIARDPLLNSSSRECVRHLQAGVRSLGATVNNTLAFYSPGSPVLHRFRLATALEGAVEFIRPLIEQSEMKLQVEDNLGAAEFDGNPGGLQQVLLNLARNALRHTQKGGTIVVAGRVASVDTKKVAIIEFSDTGAGIPAEDLPRIFEPGFTTGRQSPGLGLTVCKQIMEQHGGEITVQSNLGEGARFRLQFPLL